MTPESPEAPIPASAPPPPPARPKRRWRRWLVATVLLAALLGIGFVVSVPLALSSEAAKGWATGALRSAVASDVEIDDVDFSWGRGLSVRGLRIKNPAGFPAGDAVAIDRVTAGISFSALLAGRVKVKAEVDAPRIRVRVDEEGRSNLEALARSHGRVEPHGGSSGSGPARPGTPRGEPSDYDFQASFVVRKGSLEIVDERRGLREEVRDIEVTCANDDYGKPILVTVGARLGAAGAAAAGRVALSAKLDLGRRMPVAFFRFATTGLDLATYEPIVAVLVPGERFESFRGSIAGSLSARPSAQGGDVEVHGDLAVTDLDLRGGPLGPGRGFVAKRWTLTPSARVNLDEGTGTITGTRVDLGFAKLVALPPGEARQLFDAGAPPGSPLAVRIDLDLAELAKQPILPEGRWQGTLSIRAGALLGAGGAAGPLPFAAEVTGTGIAVAGDFLPEGTTLPDRFRLHATGSIEGGGEGSVRGRYSVASTGLEGSGRFSVGRAWEGSLRATIDAAEAGRFVAPFLPDGMELEDRAEVALEAKGGPGAPPSASGSLKAPRVRWLGNRVEGLTEKIELSGGALRLTPVDGGRFNGGPLGLTLRVDGLDREDRRVAFDLDWRDGNAAYGLTPLLQYAVPLLAGLPTDHLDRLGSIDFRSRAGLKLTGQGPLPSGPGPLLDLLAKWTAEGSLDLAQGSFTPSNALGAVLKLLPNRTKIAFDEVKTAIRIVDGRVHTKGFRMGGKDGAVTVAGSTSLAGDVDFEIDFTDLLAKRRDGKRILGLLRGKPLKVGIGGSLWNPSVRVEDFAQTILQQGVENAVQDLLKGLGSGKKPKDVLKDLLKGLGGKK